MAALLLSACTASDSGRQRDAAVTDATSGDEGIARLEGGADARPPDAGPRDEGGVDAGRADDGGRPALGSGLPPRLPDSSNLDGPYFVDGTNGSDSNPGTSSAPWQTINHALASVPPGGSVIEVRPGEYDSSGTSYAINFGRAGSTSDPITLEAAMPGTVIIGNANPDTWTIGGWVHGATGLRIEGLVFRVQATAGLNLGADTLLIENSSRIEITNCTIEDAGTIAISVRGGLNDGETANDDWIAGNTFRSSSSNVFAQVTGLGWSSDQYFGSKGSHFIYAGQYGTDTNWEIVNGSRRLVIANNIFTGTTAGRDVQLGPQARDGFVVDNTFYGNHPISLIGTSTLARFAGGGVEVFANASTTTDRTGGNLITNNIFVDLDGHATYGSGPSEDGNLVQNNLAYDLRDGEGYQDDASVDYESLYGGTVTLFDVGTNLPDADPLFVDPAGFDFHLGAGSPARGAGDPAYSLPVDREGSPRSATPSLGALE